MGPGSVAQLLIGRRRCRSRCCRCRRRPTPSGRTRLGRVQDCRQEYMNCSRALFVSVGANLLSKLKNQRARPPSPLQERHHRYLPSCSRQPPARRRRRRRLRVHFPEPNFQPCLVRLQLPTPLARRRSRGGGTLLSSLKSPVARPPLPKPLKPLLLELHGNSPPEPAQDWRLSARCGARCGVGASFVRSD